MILCLDPSLRAFGWALISDDDFYNGGCIVTSTKDSDTDALTSIATTLNFIININKVNKIIFENPVGSKSGRASHALGLVKGLVVALAISNSCEVEQINAKSIKKSLTEDQNAKKDAVFEKVKEKFPSFDKKTVDLPKFKLYAVSDAAAVYLGYNQK